MIFIDHEVVFLENWPITLYFIVDLTSLHSLHLEFVDCLKNAEHLEIKCSFVAPGSANVGP